MKLSVALLFLALPVCAQIPPAFSMVVPNYQPITASGRAKWFVESTVGPESLFLVGPISAGWGTLFNSPAEYGPGWEGFGKRYGMRLTGVSTGNAITASLGAIWGEDPRYFPSPDRAFKARVKHVILSSFVSPGRDGHYRLAYASYAGNFGNNFLSNMWRSQDENQPGDAALRCVWGFTNKMAANAFDEFWPDIKKRVFKK
jgi:hypothetical protein